MATYQVTGTYNYGNGDSYSFKGYLNDYYISSNSNIYSKIYAWSDSSDAFYSYSNSTGSNGWYTLSQKSLYSYSNFSSSLTISSYYDSETRKTYSIDSSSGGTTGLGSESGYVSGKYFNSYYEADPFNSGKPPVDDDDDESGTGSEDDGDGDSKLYTFDDSVDSYKVGTSGKDRLIISSKDKNKSWALWGDDGNDALTGGNKSDYLVGGDGFDILTGGKGADTFVMTDYLTRDYDTIRDFKGKDDVIGISVDVMDISDDASVSVLKWKDIKNKTTAEDTFDDEDADVYVFVGSTKQIEKVKSSGWTEKIQLSVNTTRKQIVYDADGDWKNGSSVLAKFTGGMTTNWSGDNFAFGLDTVG